MQFSRRELYALGEPFGDSATRKVAGGRIIYGGGGGGKSPSSTTQTQELPAWARGYAKDVLAKGAALTDINQNPYVKYGGERLAGFNPMQQQSFNSAQNMQVAPQVGQATQYATQSGQYRPVGQDYTGSNVNQYMNPYLEGALAPQLRAAASAGMEAQNMNAAKAVGMGAFGGTRGALQKSLTEKSTMQNMADINAKGYFDAFNNAQTQFNTQQGRNIQEAQYGNTAQQQAADLLSRLGGQQFQQGMDINKLQNVYGQQQQSQAQKANDIGYQDFMDQQNYAYKQLGFMSDLIKNPAIGSTSQRQMYENNSGNDLATLGGLGALGKGAGLFREGGMVGYADGGDITSYVKRLSDDQLATALKQAQQEQDQERIMVLTAEMQYRQEVRGAQAMPQEQPMDQGLAALPAGPMPQMASGGIVAFAGGNAVKGDPKEEYRAYALKQADALGIDRGLVDSIFQQESGYNPNARNPTSSATGIGQLVKKTGRSLGLKEEEFTDPYKNMDASLRFMSTLNKKYGGDPAKIAMAYHDGETVADKHLRANQGTIAPQQLKPAAQGYLEKVVGSLIPNAYAGQPPSAPQASAQAPTSAVDRIPVGGEGQAPINPRASQGRFASGLQDASEFISGTLKIPPFIPAVGAVGQGAGAVNKAAQTATAAEKAAAQAAAKIQNVRLAAPVPAGTTVMDKIRTGLGSINTANQDRASALNLANTATRANLAQAEARALKDVATQGTVYANQVAGRLGAVGAGANAMRGLGGVETAAPVAEVAPIDPEDLSKDDKKDVVDAAKKAVPDSMKKDSGFTNDDWLMLGLQMLKNNVGQKGFGQILGESGLPTLMNKKEREKMEREQESQGFVDEYRQSQAKLNEAQADYFGEGKKVREADAAVETRFKNWLEGQKANKMTVMNLTPEMQRAEYDKILREVYGRYKLPVPASLGAASVPAAVPEGTKVTRIG